MDIFQAGADVLVVLCERPCEVDENTPNTFTGGMMCGLCLPIVEPGRGGRVLSDDSAGHDCERPGVGLAGMLRGCTVIGFYSCIGSVVVIVSIIGCLVR